MPKLLADRITDIRGMAHEDDRPEGLVKIKLPAGDTSDMIDRIRRIMAEHRGSYQAIVYMPTGGSFRTEKELWVDPDDDFRRKITDIVGEENYKG